MKTKDKLKFLQIDTSNEDHLFLKVFFNKEEKHILLREKRCHLKKLIPSIQELLLSADLKLSDLDFIALNSGPGSWTGLRIGFSTVKIIAQLNNLKVITYTNFDKIKNQSIDGSGVFLVPSSNENFYYQVISENHLIEDGIANKQKIESLYPELKKFYQSLEDFNYNEILIEDYTNQRFDNIKDMEPYYIVEGVVFNKFE